MLFEDLETVSDYIGHGAYNPKAQYAWYRIKKLAEEKLISADKQKVQCDHHFVSLKRIVQHCVKCAVMKTDGLHYTRL